MKRNIFPFSIITCIILILIQCDKIETPKDEDLEELHWTNYTTSDGLVDNYVKAIAIDYVGNKWFGTDAGVSKFDGNTWTTYTTSDGLASNHVRVIAIDKEGNKWFGTDAGVSKFDGTNWTTYNASNGLADNGVNGIAIDAKGNKWFGTSNGVSKFDGTIWTNYTAADGLVNNDVNAIAIDKEGNKWFGYGPQWDGNHQYIDGGILKFNDTTWTTYTPSEGLVSPFITAIAIDSEDTKWVGGIGGVTKFDGTTFTNYYCATFIGNVVPTIAIDEQDNKWFANQLRTYPYGNLESVLVGRGVSKFDGTTWTNYTISDGLISNYIYAIAFDAQGNKWFGTDKGVTKLSD